MVRAFSVLAASRAGGTALFSEGFFAFFILVEASSGRCGSHRRVSKFMNVFTLPFGTGGRFAAEDANLPPASGNLSRTRRGVVDPERLLFRASVIVMTLLVFCLATVFNHFHVFWSGDSGVRFAMIRNWVEHGSLIYLTYPNVALDPTGQLHPFEYYLAHRPRGFCAGYLPLFPFLCGLLYRVLGWPALTVLPALAGIGTALVTAGLARRLALRCWPVLPLLLGLATPLTLYSAVFWDHSVLMFLTAGFGYWLWRAFEVPANSHRQWAFAASAGAALGAGVWFHELFLALFAAAVLASLPLLRYFQGRRLAAAVTLGFVLPLVLWAACNGWLYGTPLGPHLAANLGQNRINGDHDHMVDLLLNPALIEQRASSQILGLFDSGRLPALLIVLLLGYVFLAWSARRPLRRAAPWLCFAAAGVSFAGVIDRLPPHPLSPVWFESSLCGLFQATPVLIPMLAVPWFGRGARATVRQPKTPEVGALAQGIPLEWGRPAFLGWVSRTCVFFILLMVVSPFGPGVDWGSRYLLTVLPLLTLLAAVAIERHLAEANPPQRSALTVGLIALFGVSVFYQVAGDIEVGGMLRYNLAVNRQIRALTTPVVATDLMWLGAELTPLPLKPVQFTVRTPEDRAVFVAAIQRVCPSGFVYAGTPEGLPAFARAASHGAVPYVPVQAWQDVQLQFARFVPRLPAKEPPVPRRVLALYYPWYGTPQRSGGWLHQDGADPARGVIADHVHYPQGGPYDSTDPALAERHLRQAQAAGIDTLVCSWWGLGDQTDKGIRLLLQLAPRYGLHVCVYWERLRRPGAPAAVEDLAYLVNALADYPAYLRQGGRPVVFLNGRVCQSLNPDEWAAVMDTAESGGRSGPLLIGEGHAPADIMLWDGLYSLSTLRFMAGLSPGDSERAQAETFGPLTSATRRFAGLSVETVIPGYDDRLPGTLPTAPSQVAVRHAGALYGALWQQALTDGPDWVLVNSFNEWHNGTEIEPSVEMGDGYLALTRQWADRFRGAAASGGVWKGAGHG